MTTGLVLWGTNNSNAKHQWFSNNFFLAKNAFWKNRTKIHLL